MNLTTNQFDGGGDVAPPKIKVSQGTVDAVKDDGRGNMGVGAANKVAYGSPGYDGSTFSPNAPVSAEYKEATTRVYPNAKATSPGASSGYANPKAPGNSKAAPKKSALPPVMPPSASGATNPNQPGPKAATPTKIKVSQETIDAIKKAGKEKSIGATKYKGVSAEYKEGVRRLYQSPTPKKAKTTSGGGGGGSKSGSATL
jgi:hypothetical protein